MRRANPRASLDAAIAFCLHFGAHWRRASEAGRLSDNYGRSRSASRLLEAHWDHS